jgi:hypothetical protein
MAETKGEKTLKGGKKKRGKEMYGNIMMLFRCK